MKFVKTDFQTKDPPKTFFWSRGKHNRQICWMKLSAKSPIFFLFEVREKRRNIFFQENFPWNSSSGYVELSYEGSAEHFCVKFRNFVSKVRKRFQWLFTSNFCSLRIIGGHVEGILDNRSNNFRENSEIFLLRIGNWPTINLFSSTI